MSGIIRVLSGFGGFITDFLSGFIVDYPGFIADYPGLLRIIRVYCGLSGFITNSFWTLATIFFFKILLVSPTYINH